MCPGIAWFFHVRPGVWRMPIDPIRRWNMEPWAAGPPPTRKRFTTPWNPLPFVIPMTSTSWPSWKADTVTTSPTFSAGEAGRRTSERTRGACSTPAFFACAISALLEFLAFLLENPIWTAL